MFHKFYDRAANSHCNMQSMHRAKKQSGSALVVAIFIIIVISILGAALVNILDSSQESVAYEVLGTRAYTAAQSGVQWQLGQIFPVGASSDAVNGCSAASPPVITNIDGLKGCSIVDPVACTEFTHKSVRYFTVTSTGECNIDGEITSRTVEVEARSL
jgi:MSHA biogenesis protein MshP